jgi:hypothetical protein
VIFHRTARLILHDKVYEEKRIRNLSIVGLFLAGKFDAAIGDLCTIELHETGHHASLILTFSAKVVRVESDGIGLEFFEMKPDSYMFLQTMILYATKDPLGVAEEFLEDFPPGTMASY